MQTSNTSRQSGRWHMPLLNRLSYVNSLDLNSAFGTRRISDLH